MITIRDLKENPELLEEAKKLHKERTGRSWSPSCSNCWDDLAFYYNNLKPESMKNDCQFHIKDELGGSFRIFGSDEYFSNDTITDEQCYEFIKKNIKHLAYFDEYPKDIDKLISKSDLTKEEKLKKETEQKADKIKAEAKNAQVILESDKPAMEDEASKINFKTISVEDLKKIFSIEDLQKICDDKKIIYHQRAGYKKLAQLLNENI